MNALSNCKRRAFIGRAGLLAAAGGMLGSLPAWAFVRLETFTQTRTQEIMLQDLALTHFAPHLGETFTLHLATGQVVSIELIEAMAFPTPSQRPAHLSARVPFSVVFQSAQTSPLPQQIYHVKHAALGGFDLFLVPIGQHAKGVRYEAVFN